MKDATNKGASNENKRPEDAVTMRMQQEEELMKMHEELRKNDGVPYDSDGDSEVRITEVEAPTEKAPEALKKEETKGEPPEIEEEFDTLKINGVEQKVEKSKIYDQGKRAMQKELAADQMLREASEKLKEADRIAEEAKQKSQKLAKELESGLEYDEDVVDSIANDLFYGDDSEKKDAVKRLLEQQGASKATTENITTEEVDRIIAEREQRKDFESALKWVQRPADEGGFDDLFDGGILEGAMTSEDVRLANEQPGLSYRDRLQKAGENVRKAMNLNPTNNSKTSNNDSENESRKAELGDTPTAISAGPMGDVDMQKDIGDKQNEAINAEIARRRGG